MFTTLVRRQSDAAIFFYLSRDFNYTLYIYIWSEFEQPIQIYCGLYFNVTAVFIISTVWIACILYVSKYSLKYVFFGTHHLIIGVERIGSVRLGLD